jgi:predicted O-linked N-acetylglucosamine transferase (SPINDLY family)
LSLAEAVRLHAKGDLAAAEALYLELLGRAPRDHEILHFLGALELQRARPEAALPFLKRAAVLSPRNASYLNTLGVAHWRLRKERRAVSCFGTAVRLEPGMTVAWRHLGIVLMAQRRFADAARALRRAAVLDPQHALTWTEMGRALLEIGSYREAVRSLENALALEQTCPRALALLGQTSLALRRFREAEDASRRSVKIDERQAWVWNNLGATLFLQGRLEEATRSFERAVGLDPNLPSAQSSLLAIQNYSLADPETVFEKHRDWGMSVERATFLRRVRSRPDGDVPRRLRLGYVSSEFNSCPVSKFIEPILACHDRSRFDVYCYANLRRRDEVTARLRSRAHVWREIHRLDDEEVCSLIASDEIDILVDLAGHTRDNRLRVFARKPAPIQVTYLGYPNTTGLSRIDYRLTDAFADPVGSTERLHTERLFRLEPGFLCYQPPGDAPPPELLPAFRRGRVTFGCFALMAKIHDDAITAWASILERVPGSRLILKSYPLWDEGVRELVLERFRRLGIPSHRLELRPYARLRSDHYRSYHEIDLALDTFPYNGTATTCDALWMGVPVLTLAGRTHLSRVGGSLLRRMGLDCLITYSWEHYVDRAVQLSQELARLSRLRSGLRSRVTAAGLTSGERLTRVLEDGYREMWRRRCEPGHLAPRDAD